MPGQFSLIQPYAHLDNDRTIKVDDKPSRTKNFYDAQTGMEYDCGPFKFV
jgi:hypothetical protein